MTETKIMTRLILNKYSYATVLMALFVLQPYMAKCGTINFAGGTWSIQQIHGTPIEVKNVELAGDGIMFFTRADGSKGFVNITNVKNMGELEDMVNNHSDEATSQERERKIKYEQLKNKSERLQNEIQRRERDLDNELTQMANSGGSYYFNMKKYCQSVSEAVGGSYQIEQGCMMNEKSSKRNLDSMHIEGRILNYCKEVSDAVGGSYQIMYGCVMNERSARGRLR